MAKTKKKELTANEQNTNKLLQDTKNKYSTVFIIGVLENGTLEFVSNVGHAALGHWMLNTAQFKLSVMENNAEIQKQQKEANGG